MAQEKSNGQAKPVGIWIRVSTEDQAKGESPEHHEKRARYYAESKGWNVLEVYHLEAVSGKSVKDHPEARRMITDIRSGHITGLIFSKLARLARNTKELLEFADIFQAEEADLVSLQESIDTSTAAGRFFYTVIAAMAQWEREEISDRVAASVPIRAKLGKPLGGAAPFGYRWLDRKLVPDPKEAPVRKHLYELFLKEHRKKTVARLLNEAGYRTRNGSKFSDTTVDRLLRDPSARGLRRANYTKSLGEGKKWVMKPEKDWVLSEIDPIVSEELWDQCNRILDEQRAQRKPPAKKTVHLFSGLVYCEACGTKMPVPSKSSNYYCRKCHNKIGIADLEFIFQEQLKAFFLSPEEIAKNLSQADQTIKAKEELLATLMKESAQIREEMDKIMRLYLDGTMPQEAVGRHYKPLEERFKQLENQIPELQGEIDFLKIQYLSSDEIVSEATNLYSQWPNLEPEDKRRIVETITERISISGQDISIHLSYIPQSLNSSALATQPHPCVAILDVRLRAKKPVSKAYPSSLKTIGDHIRKRRLDLNLTQKQAAEKLGVDEASVWNWEKGEVLPLARQIPPITSFLEYDPFSLDGDSLADELKRYCATHGLTQKELARQIGIDPATLSRIQKGGHKSFKSIISKVASFIDSRAARNPKSTS